MKLFNSILNRIEEIFVSIALASAVTITFMEVILRQFGQSLSFTYELVNYLLIWTGLIGASIGVRANTHLGVDILVTNFKAKTQKFVLMTTTSLNILFSIIIAVLGYQHVLDLLDFGQVTPEMELPLYIPRLLIPIAFGLIAIRFSQELVRIIKTKADDLVTSQQESILEKEGLIESEGMLEKEGVLHE